MTDRTASRPSPADSSGQEHRAPEENASIVNNVVYLDGRRVAALATLAGTFRLLERLVFAGSAALSSLRAHFSH